MILDSWFRFVVIFTMNSNFIGLLFIIFLVAGKVGVLTFAVDCGLIQISFHLVFSWGSVFPYFLQFLPHFLDPHFLIGLLFGLAPVFSLCNLDLLIMVDFLFCEGYLFVLGDSEKVRIILVVEALLQEVYRFFVGFDVSEWLWVFFLDLNWFWIGVVECCGGFGRSVIADFTLMITHILLI